MNDKNKNIIVVGSANTDMVIRADHFPQPGETILGNGFMTNHGGKGANQAVAAARLGGNVKFIARVGDDGFGQSTIDMLNKEGIDVTHVSVTPGTPSGVAIITTVKSGENTIIVDSGANAKLSAEDIEKAEDSFKSGGLLLMQLENSCSHPCQGSRHSPSVWLLSGAQSRSSPCHSPTSGTALQCGPAHSQRDRGCTALRNNCQRRRFGFRSFEKTRDFRSEAHSCHTRASWCRYARRRQAENHPFTKDRSRRHYSSRRHLLRSPLRETARRRPTGRGHRFRQQGRSYHCHTTRRTEVNTSS